MTYRSRNAKTPPSRRIPARERYISPRGMITPISERVVQPYRSFRDSSPRGQSTNGLPMPAMRSKSPAPIHPSGPIPRQQLQQPVKNISPIVRHGPITGQQALLKYESLLTPYEKKEILDFEEVYYVGYLQKKVKADSPHSEDYQFDLGTHHYKVGMGDHLYYRYEIRSILGKGAFGQVLRCTDHKTKETVAVKIIVNTPQMKKQGEAEISMVTFLNEEDPNDSNCIVRVLDTFHFRDHSCIVFEMLGNNLYEFSKSNYFKRAAINQVRTIGRQILKAIKFTHSRGIVHCDMKPENVLLLLGSNVKIKVIDFGSACYIGQKHFDYIQSRFYRAPEVMLGIQYGPPMDIWSFACVIAELAMGKPLFPGGNECHQLQLQMQVLGSIPDDVMKKATRREVFFDEYGKIFPYNGRRKKVGSVSLQKITGITDPDLLDLLQKCLEWDQDKRITAADALNHKFFETSSKKSSNIEKNKDQENQNVETSNSNKITDENKTRNSHNYIPGSNLDLVKKVPSHIVNSKKYVSPSNYAYQSNKSKKKTSNTRGKSPAALSMGIADTSSKKRQKSLSDSNDRVFDGRIGYNYSNLNSNLYRSKNKGKSPSNSISKSKNVTSLSTSSPTQSRVKQTASLLRSTKSKAPTARSSNSHHSSIMTSTNQAQNRTKNDTQVPRRKSPRRKSPSYMVSPGY